MPTMYEMVKNWLQGEPVPPQVIAGLNKQIEANKVIVYSKTHCPYCKSTKETLRKLGAPFEVVELDRVKDGRTLQRGLTEITGQKTVPNIFINGKHIGGNSDLQKLAKGKQLQQMLA